MSSMDFELGCEECGTEEERLFDTIADNRPLRLCEKCARTNNAIILEEESKKMGERWEARGKPKVPNEEKPKTCPSMNDLWERARKVKEEREAKKAQELKEKEIKEAEKVAFLEEREFVEDLEKEKVKEKQEIIEEIEKDITLNENNEQNVEFNEEASKKVKIKEFLKETFNFLKE